MSASGYTENTPAFRTPVALIVFNRPALTEKLLGQLRLIKPTTIFVIADGPRETHPTDKAACAKVREVVQEKIDWPAKVLTNYSEKNLGLRRRVSSGLDWVFQKVDRAIILEDDLLPSAGFFHFCAELLEKYQDNERIGAITGDNFQAPGFSCEASYYFSKYPHCWGWATWKRAWRHYDHKMAGWAKWKKQKSLEKIFTDPRQAFFWEHTFDQVRDRKLDSWASVWTFSCWVQNLLTATPKRNLVANIGFGADATHTVEAEAVLCNLPVFEIGFPLCHPKILEINQAADAFTQKTIFDPSAPLITHSKPRHSRMATFLKKFRGRLSGQTSNEHQPIDPLTPAPQLLAEAKSFLERKELPGAFLRLNHLKARQIPARETDFLRALCFLQKQQSVAAVEALKEELRFFPDHVEAAALLKHLIKTQDCKTVSSDGEFQELFQVIKGYTMLGEARLWSLFSLAKEVCQKKIPGNFAECGVAAGGSSALLAAVISRYSDRPRRLFSFDTFAGMPESSGHDLHDGEQAEATGWGRGTCAAAEMSLLEVCQKLKVENIVQPVKGLFSDTLPTHRQQIGLIAFLHMDGDWYSSTRDILINLFDQVVPEGKIQIDDYGYWEGCRRAVEEFERERSLKFKLHVIDETGVWLSK